MPLPMLKEIPYPVLGAAALLLGLAPLVPQPHLWEKLQLLWSGELKRTIDRFDLLFHLAPALLLALKWLTERDR